MTIARSPEPGNLQSTDAPRFGARRWKAASPSVPPWS